MLAEGGTESKRLSIAKDKGREAYKSNVSFWDHSTRTAISRLCRDSIRKRNTCTLGRTKKKNTYSYLTCRSLNIHLPRETLESGASKSHYAVRVQLDETGLTVPGF